MYDCGADMRASEYLKRYSILTTCAYSSSIRRDDIVIINGMLERVGWVLTKLMYVGEVDDGNHGFVVELLTVERDRVISKSYVVRISKLGVEHWSDREVSTYIRRELLRIAMDEVVGLKCIRAVLE